MKTFTIITALVMLLAGCAQVSQLRMRNADYSYYWIKPGQAPASGQVVALLYYADYVRNLGATEYAQETEHARQLYTQEKSDFRLLQYALALLLPEGDAHKAQQLIESLLQGTRTSDPELRALALLLDSDLEEDQAERRRLEAEIKRAEANARRAEAGVRRADELEKKVEAIKNIEKNMIERGKSSGEKP